MQSARILEKLDSYLARNDYKSAEEYLLNIRNQCELDGNMRLSLLINNELIGLYRKLSRKNEAFDAVNNALSLIDKMNIEQNVGAATTYINVATCYKAFGLSQQALPLFEKTLAIYKRELRDNDPRFGGLYNNMALALVDEGHFDKAYEYYSKAIETMEKVQGGDTEIAITYLNIASAKEAQLGAEQSEKQVGILLDKASELLDNHLPKDGHYAFVCEKCASVYGYFGYFAYENKLKKIAEEIYERS